MGIETRVAFIFTGQGSQHPGMLAGLERSTKAWEVIQVANKTMGFPLSDLCETGPQEILNQTRYAQPAIVTCSMALLAATRQLHSDLPEPVVYLGHSVGELSAMAESKVIEKGPGAAIELARQRGLLMGEVHGQMAAILGKSIDQVQELCKQSGAQVANINCPGQIVVSGSEESITKIKEAVGDPRRARLLDVSGPFHSSLMIPHQEEWRRILNRESFQDAEIPIILNVNAKPTTNAEMIRQKSAEQLASKVLWWQSIEYAISQGVTTFIEFGPSAILTGFLKRINSSVRGMVVTDYESAQALSF